MITRKAYINNSLSAYRHRRSFNLSFADEQVEHWVWKNSKNPVSVHIEAENEADLADFRRLQAAALR